MKPAHLRPQAEQDLVAAARWYADQGGADLGGRFFDAARQALQTVESAPSIGSPVLGKNIGIPGLRTWAVNTFPVRWFYFERDAHVDVVRLLGDRQDIAVILAADPPQAS